MNENTNRYINSVAIAYIIVTVVTLVALSTEDPRLPLAFFLSLVSPKFWSIVGMEFMIFMGVMFSALLIAYVRAVVKPSKGAGVLQGILSAIGCSIFYLSGLVVLMLSGLRH